MRGIFSRFVTDYGMIFVLVLLCGYFSWATYGVHAPDGAAAGEQVARKIQQAKSADARVLIVAGESNADAAFADEARKVLGASVIATIKGQPADLREQLQKIVDRGERLDAIAASRTASSWTLLDDLPGKFSSLSKVEVVAPETHGWPDFLTSANLLNVANRIAVIAIIAIGMTMVIITGGIDLSVGSLIALSAVCSALLIEHFGGGESAGAAWIVLGSLGGIAICAAMGLFSGWMVTLFPSTPGMRNIPAFIATLAMMLITSGAAFDLTGGQSVGQLPAGFMWLRRGADLGVPNSVVLMVVLYAVAYVVMSRTTLGRYIYAVGGNVEAARLSGVPVRRVIVMVYAVCGALAGLGGVITASLFKSGDPKYGPLAELYVIAAVVVGGTSLSGGEGKVLGTLIGALIIGVIENGMNLTNVGSYTQKIVLGAVLLGAVLLDTIKNNTMRRR